MGYIVDRHGYHFIGEENSNESYDEGYEDGWNSAYDQGYDNGFFRGYEKAKKDLVEMAEELDPRPRVY